MTASLLGVDLGTTSFKATLFTVAGEERGTVSYLTPWRTGPGGRHLRLEDFSAAVLGLVDAAVVDLAAGTVAGIGVTGMAETVFAWTSTGDALPATAWNDRGPACHTDLPDPHLVARTGLLDFPRTSAAALRGLAPSGQTIGRWANLPEQAVVLLGGEQVAEYSLASRSGLLDVQTRAWSPALFDWAGLDLRSAPRLVPAGSPVGTVRTTGACAGAVLTVAGHDHLVAAVGAGATGPDAVFDSIGTGEAVIAPITAGQAAQVAGFNAAGFNVGAGVEDGSTNAVCGLGTGNRFTMILDALDRAGYPRAQVMTPDDASAGPLGPALVDLVGAVFHPRWRDLVDSDRAGRVVRDTVDSLAVARAVWVLAVRTASERVREALRELARLTGRPRRVLAAGGWLQDPQIRAIRAEVIGAYEIPATAQAGTRGAALLAGRACGAFPTAHDYPPIATTRIGDTGR
ncbi:FGGY family carbohydrate kinase [Phytohabitans kaempferiae]|uniref:FGGY family carbohydrate kinase n=1 Tax=Phytohabitans kaempferiae TaxID=1620943 RepID=A0ABV6M9V9_9ACTN